MQDLTNIYATIDGLSEKVKRKEKEISSLKKKLGKYKKLSELQEKRLEPKEDDDNPPIHIEKPQPKEDAPEIPKPFDPNNINYPSQSTVIDVINKILKVLHHMRDNR